MKTVTIITVILITASINSFGAYNYDEDKKNHVYATTDDNSTSWPKINISINAGGFLFIGPMLQADFRIGGKTYVGAYYINHYLGLCSKYLIFDNTISSYSPKSMGGGIYIKHYMKPKDNLNAWFLGFNAGYSYNEAKYHEGILQDEKIEEVDNIVLFAQGGYRWNIGKKLYLDAGLHFGVSIAARDEIYWVYQYNQQTGQYEENHTLFDDYSGDAYPFINPELSIGISF